MIRQNLVFILKPLDFIIQSLFIYLFFFHLIFQSFNFFEFELLFIYL